MAGIGFELKKLFNKRGFINRFRAYIYASLVTVGPMMLCVLLVTLMQVILYNMGVSHSRRELFVAAIVYSFVFSLIITSGFSMVLTRYVSDRIYKKEYEFILPSLYGAISICLIIGSIVGFLFFYRSPLDIIFKIAAYIIFIELIIIWLQSVLLTTLKDYRKITKAFFLGVLAAFIASCLLIYVVKVEKVNALLISLDIGLFIIAVLSMFYIREYFKTVKGKEVQFISYLDKYPSLFFISLFYTLGSYIHNFVFWASPNAVVAGGTYVFAPIYDVPVFYAFISIIPSMVVFVVRVETSFYEKYREYYQLITNGGSLREIKIAKTDMIQVLVEEIKYIMELQLFFAIIALVAGMILLPRLGLSGESIDAFGILVFACYCNIIMLIVMLLQLYFDDRKGALIISATFVSCSFFFSIITVFLGENYYGLGFFAAAFVALIVAFLRMFYFIKNIDYFTFCSQPIVIKDIKGLFTKLVD